MLFFFPLEVMTMKLEVILPTARHDRPTTSVTLNDGKYLAETRFRTCHFLPCPMRRTRKMCAISQDFGGWRFKSRTARITAIVISVVAET
jgi:hypothetical protein